MSELSAFLADHELEELEGVLHDNGMDLIRDLEGLSLEDYEALGASREAAGALLGVLGATTAYTAAPVAASLSPPPAPPPFQWRRSTGELLAEATENPLPPPPPPPPAAALRRVSSSVASAVFSMPPPPPIAPTALTAMPPPLQAPPPQAPLQAAAPEPPTPSMPPLTWRRSVEGVWDEAEEGEDAEVPAPVTVPAPASPLAPPSEATGPEPSATQEMHGWEEIHTEDGTYYFHAATNVTTWDRPLELGERWVAHLTDDGVRYFCNELTGDTTWEAPQFWVHEAHAAAAVDGEAAAAVTTTAAAAAPAASDAASDANETVYPMEIPSESDRFSVFSPPPPMAPLRQRSSAAIVAAAVAAAGPSASTAGAQRRQPPPIPHDASSRVFQPDALPGAAAPSGGGAQGARGSVIGVVLGSGPAPPAPPPFVWRRSNGECLSKMQQAQQQQQSGGEFTATIARNAHGLGLSFNDGNEVVSIDPRGGAAAGGEVHIHDVCLAVDGITLHGQPIREVMPRLKRNAPSATLLLRRPGALGENGGGAAATAAVATAAAAAGDASSGAGAPEGTNDMPVDVSVPGGVSSSADPSVCKPTKASRKLGPGWVEVQLGVVRPGGSGPLGLSLNDANVVLAVREGGVCDGILRGASGLGLARSATGSAIDPPIRLPVLLGAPSPPLTCPVTRPATLDSDAHPFAA